MEAAGVEVARMEIGRPDFDTPAHVKQAAKDALDAGRVHYTTNKGIEELRMQIAAKLRRDNGLDVDPEGGILVTVGCKEAILLALLAFVEAGDEVIVPSPSWDNYQHATAFLGGTPVAMTLDEANGYQPDLERLERSVTDRTKMLVLISPHNPTGVVFNRESLEGIATIARRRDLLVVSDEIYEKLVYDDEKHISIASMPGMAERTITINGFSKAYAMDGWRLGYAAGPEALINPMLKVHQYTTNCATTFVQWGGVAAYAGPQDAVATMRAEFDRRRRMVLDHLARIDGVRVVRPGGAFYVFPTFDLDMRADALAEYVLKEAHVACVPGTVFGPHAKPQLRLSYATRYDAIERGLERLAKVIPALRV